MKMATEQIRRDTPGRRIGEPKRKQHRKKSDFEDTTKNRIPSIDKKPGKPPWLVIRGGNEKKSDSENEFVGMRLLDSEVEDPDRVYVENIGKKFDEEESSEYVKKMTKKIASL